QTQANALPSPKGVFFLTLTALCSTIVRFAQVASDHLAQWLPGAETSRQEGRGDLLTGGPRCWIYGWGTARQLRLSPPATLAVHLAPPPTFRGGARKARGRAGCGCAYKSKRLAPLLSIDHVG